MNKKMQHIWFVVLVNYLMLLVVSILCSCNLVSDIGQQDISGNLEVLVALPNTASNYTVTRQFVYKRTTDNYEKMYLQSQSWMDSKIANNPDFENNAVFNTISQNSEYSLYRSQTWLYPETVSKKSSENWNVTVIFSIYDSEQVLYSNYLYDNDTEEIQPIEMETVSFVFPQEEGSGYLSKNMETSTFGSVPVSLSYEVKYEK